VRRRFAFTDPSGGGGRETFPLAVASMSLIGNKAVLLGLWDKRPPFSPDAVVEEYAAIIKSYGLTTVTGDRYAGSWPAERFAAHGIRYEPSARTKSEIFLEFIPLVNSGRVRIPNDRRLRQQFIALERRTSRAGRDSVDHPPSGLDDLANAAAGALVLASAQRPRSEPHLHFLDLRRDGEGESEPGSSVTDGGDRGWERIV
jgi:hypothetical protein